MAALGIAVHINRSSSIFSHLGSRLLAGIGQSLFGIIHDQFLAKGIDKVLGTARDDKLIWVHAGKLHRIAYHIAPQAAGCGDDHSIVLAHFYAPERNDGRIIAAKLIHRDELVEHVVIYHERHGRICRVVLQAEEALAGIVSLHIMHVRRSDELLILLAVRREGDAAMEEHLQVWPHFLQMLLAGKLHHTHQYAEHPARNTRDIGHVLVQGFMGNAVALHLEVAEQSRLLLWHTHHVGKRIDVLDEDGAQVAHQTARHIIVRRMATAENQAFAIENLALRIIAQIICHGIKATFVMDVLQSILRNRNKLTLVVGGTRRFGKPLHLSRPKDILFTMSHTVDIPLQFLVGVDRHILGKLLVTVCCIE